MKRIALLLVSTIGFTISLFAQKELTISGGNCVSGMVCENSIVYAWGKNSTTVNGNKNYGLLGVGSTNDYEAMPKEVTYFSSRDIYIQQVNCGSGSHFIALDCQGNVWCWGNNSLGQCGTGGSVVKQEGKIQAEPIQVSTAGGDLKNTAYNKNGHLGGVDVVYAGNNNSFAILGDGAYKGCLVGWGGNSTGFDGQGYDNAFGQLGCGNTDNQAYPVFVKTPDGNPLKGVVQVYAGDNSAYALVDPDGDGIGTIYSWGYQKGNGSLGRSKTGGTGNTDDFNDPYARPVKKSDGTNLDNIKMLGCGDGVGYGLDTDGYIWAWGNGAWNNSAGVLDADYSWYSDGANYATPLRVRKGKTTGASNDGTYLLAKWVAGGQGYGMAITADNKPVAWGGGGCSDGGGGATGTKIGQSADKAGAEYIVNSSGGVHSDVVLINRADLWGFYGRGNGELFAWGCNDNGQLGLGDTQPRTKAAKINPPTNCNPRHPDPTVDLSPGNMTVCASAFQGVDLDAGFVVGMELATYYNITWYKDGTEVLSGSIKEKGTTYRATEPGTYKVQIDHITNGSGNGCVSYDPAVAEMTISAYPQTFTIPDMSYCNDTVEVYVNAQNGSKAIYSWYAKKGVNATPIAQTNGSQKIKVYVGDDVITPNSSGIKTIYVEETSAGVGSFIPSNFTNFTAQQNQVNNIPNPGFTVQSAVTLRDFKLKAKGVLKADYVPSGGTTLTGKLNITVTLCNAKTDNGHLVANKSSVIKTFSGSLSMEKEVTQQGEYTFNETITFDAGNYKLNPGNYFLVVSGITASGSCRSDLSYVYYASNKGIVGVKDNYTGDYIVGIGAAQDNNFQTGQAGAFFDINFATPQGFCDRIAIDLPEDCPCDAPDDVFINQIGGTDFFATGDSTIVICENASECTLTTEAWAASTGTSASAFEYVWYKDGAISKAATVGYTSAAYRVTDKGIYTIMVYDKNAPTVKSCQKTAKVEVKLNPVPTVKVTGGGEFCEGEDSDFSTPVTFTMTGEPRFRVYWDITDPTGTTKTKNKRSDANTVVADVPTTVGTYTYTVKSVNDDGNCKNENVSGTATIVVKPVPVATITPDPASATVCEGTGTVALTASATPTDNNTTYAWEFNGSSSGTGAGKTLTDPNQSGMYSVKATLSGCTSDPVTQEVTINPTPVIKTLTSNKDAVCSGGTINLSATVSDAGDGEFTWSGEGVTGNGSTATVTNDVTSDTPVTITLNYKSKEGCEAVEKTITVTFYAYPDPPVVKDQAYCVDDTPKQLEATPNSGATLNWYGTNETGGTASSTAPTPSTAAAGETFYYVSQTINGCESKTRAMATVTVDDTLAPVITADPGFEVCENAPIALNVEGSFRSTVWSGAGASYLDATTIQNPTFTATKGSYDVIVKVEDTKGCKGSAKKTITINPIPEITQLSQLTDKCVSDETTQTITATVTPSGISGTGTWNGDVTNPANTSASYTPSVAGVGTHTITYDFVSDKGCVAEQKSTSVEVFDMPNPSISLSNTSVCVSGNNSDVVTVSTTGTQTTGTFSYSVNNSGTVDASTGAFNPTANSAGNYTITLNYADANGCKGTASADLTVHALPTVKIDDSNPSEICYNAPAIDITTTVSPTGGTGVWTGTTSSTSASFNPTAANETTTITYTYTDEFKCVNSDETTITKVTVNAPNAIQTKTLLKNAGVLDGTTELTGSVSTTGDVLQWMPETGGSVLPNGDNVTTYQTGLGNSDPAGSYKYAVREYRMVNGKECYSKDSVIAVLVISECNALAPTAADRWVCVNSTEAQTFTAERTIKPTSPSNYQIGWLTSDPVGKNGMLATEGTGLTFNPNISTATATSAEYYVAEYDEDNSCWSAGTKVTIRVVDNPVVTIESPENICAKGNEAVHVTVSPQNGVISTNAGTMDGFQWLPGDYSGDKEEATFTYTVTSDAYADGTTCQTTVTSTTTAHFMEAPTGSTTNWLIGNIDGITNGLLTGTRTSTGQTITWYDTQTKNNVLQAAGDAYTPDKTALKAEVGSADTYVKKYWITQTDAYTCESAPTEVILNLIDCPWEAPTVTGDKKCHGFDLDPLKGTQGPSVASQSSSTSLKWNWYNEQKSLITTTTAAAGSEAAYPHGVSKTTDGITTFYVSYSANEKNSGNECESPMTKVTVTVLPLPTVTFDKQSEIVCYTTEETKINVTPASENGAGSGVWSITGDPSAISSNGIFYAQANGELDGQNQYTITYTYTDAEGCVFSNDRTIDVIYLSAPQTQGFYAMTTQNNPVTVKVTSNLTTGASAKWFESETLVNDEKGTGTSWATGDATNLTVDKNYYARQYKDGCYSESTVANVKIVPCPIPSVVIGDEKACNYEEVPTLKASTGEWAERDASQSVFKFYTSETATTQEKISSDGTYKPSLTTEGEYKYYVSEYSSMPLQNLTISEGCEGPRKAATITIVGTGVPTISATINPAEVCEGEDNPSFVATNIVGTIGWYEEDPGELGVPQAITRGNEKTFTPSGSVADTYSIWAVMYANECYGPKVKAEYTIKEIPAAPQTESVEICSGESNKSVTATSTGSVNWYADAQKVTILSKGSLGYLSKEALPGEYTYYATQVVAGCESKTNPAVFRIKSLPSVPVITQQKNLCDYESAPTLYASGENITWYAQDKTTVIGSGESLQTNDMEHGTKRFYASQTVEGCEGEAVLLSYVVYEKPANPIVVGASVCEGNEEIPSLSTNMPTDKWYADEMGNTYLTSGYNYTPDFSEVGQTDKTYYVQREINGCVSDMMPVLLTVVPKPELIISGDTTLCIYDEVVPIQAFKFYPAMNDASSVDWQVKAGKVTKFFDDEEGHQIVPSSVINAEGTYGVSAVYKYVYNGIYCLSDTVGMKYTVKGRARKPIVFSSVICQGDDIKDLQALGSPNVEWGSLDGTNPPVAKGQRYHFSAGQVLDTGTYRFVIRDINIYDVDNNLGCYSEADTVSMTVAPAAKTKLFGADSVCVGSTEQYYTEYTKESTYFWNVTGSHLNYSKDAISSSVRYVDWMESGIDTLTVYEQTWAGCEGWDTLVVKIAAMPKALYTWDMPGASNIIELTDSTTQDTLWYKNDEGELVGDPVTYTLSWNYGHIGEDENFIDTVVAYEQRNFPLLEGDYIYGYNCPILRVENSFGCKDVYKECIFVNITSSLYVPTAFSPSNPAHSVRTFQPKGYNLKTCEISVFDKWGNLLWHSDAVEDGKFVGSWDGRCDGKMMKSDVYIWKMEATFLDGQEWQGFDVGHGKKAKFGSVTLVR